MQQININVLKPHPRNNEFFDDLSGDEFERLKNSIRDEKIYTDILVSPDMTIISGHQRIRAAKEIGLTLVPIKIDEDLQDEDSKLRALISNNFGRRKNDPEKDRRAIAKYVELKGYKNGELGNGRKKECQDGTAKLTLDEIAKELNTSKRNLQRALRIERNLTDSMKELLDSGEISKTLAADTIASMSEEEQEDLISKLDTTKKITQREVQKYVNEIKNLKENPVIEKPDDYNSTKRELQNYKKDYINLQSQFNEKVLELQDLRKQVENMKATTPTELYSKKLKDSTIFFCSKVADFIEKTGGYVWLVEHLNELPDYERKSYISAVNAVYAWADNLLRNIND
ncbi:MAG: ParB/RepB/Spo0J family partition protein [Coprococcus sp.]